MLQGRAGCPGTDLFRLQAEEESYRFMLTPGMTPAVCPNATLKHSARCTLLATLSVLNPEPSHECYEFDV